MVIFKTIPPFRKPGQARAAAGHRWSGRFGPGSGRGVGGPGGTRRHGSMVI
jgi:hypothetical protein